MASESGDGLAGLAGYGALAASGAGFPARGLDLESPAFVLYGRDPQGGLGPALALS